MVGSAESMYLLQISINPGAPLGGSKDIPKRMMIASDVLIIVVPSLRYQPILPG